MDFLKKFFPLSKSMSDTFKRYLIGCGIYAAIMVVVGYVINLITVPLALFVAIPVIGWFIGIPILTVLSYIPTLVEVYCLCGVVLLTAWFWHHNTERDSLKKFFPLAYKLNGSRSEFIVSIVLYVAAVYAMGIVMPIVSMPFSLIPVVGGLLSSFVSVAVPFYYAATLIQHILAYCDGNQEESAEEPAIEEMFVDALGE